MLNKENNYKSNLVLITLLVVMVFLYGFLLGQLNVSKSRPKLTRSQNHFSLNYKNESSEPVLIRYKYKLNAVPANDAVFALLDPELPLFSLTQNKEQTFYSYPNLHNSTTLPEVSDVITLKENESTNDFFEIYVNEEIKDIQDKIRFEVHIFVEELKENSWSLVYQIIFMERGPYWSLDKGPIQIPPPK